MIELLLKIVKSIGMCIKFYSLLLNEFHFSYVYFFNNLLDFQNIYV